MRVFRKEPVVGHIFLWCSRFEVHTKCDLNVGRRGIIKSKFLFLLLFLAVAGISLLLLLFCCIDCWSALVFCGMTCIVALFCGVDALLLLLFFYSLVINGGVRCLLLLSIAEGGGGECASIASDHHSFLGICIAADFVGGVHRSSFL